MTSPSVEDIGLVTLNRSIGGRGNGFGIGSSSNNAFFAGNTFDTAGYPANAGSYGPQMFAGSGKALGMVSSDGIGFAQSSLAAVPGQSGSPIYRFVNGTPVIYGVVTGANGFTWSSEVYAARITPAVYNELKAWEKADRAPSEYYGPTTLQHPVVNATQASGAVSTGPIVYALDVGWASNPNVYSMYGDPYYGSWGYNPIGYSYGNVYTGPQFVQGYGLNYGTENPYASDPYTQFGADFGSYWGSSYSQRLSPDMEWPVEVAY